MPPPISRDTIILDNDITFSYCDSELDVFLELDLTFSENQLETSFGSNADVNFIYMLLDELVFDTTIEPEEMRETGENISQRRFLRMGLLTEPE